MKNINIKRYSSENQEVWNDFISQTKNGTFLFHRDFMDYHCDRFQDYSLLIYDKQKLIALLPANVVGNEIFSHQGLTYGGLLYSEKLKLTSVITVFAAVLEFLHQNNFVKIYIKTIPSIYHTKPAEELNYALFLVEAKLTRRDSLSVINLRETTTIVAGRKEGVKKGISSNLIIKEVTDFDAFWNQILMPNLAEKHNAKPVHSLAEITKLKRLFPENIKQFNVHQNDVIVAGTTLFESQNVVHAQYISGDETKSENGSLDFLYHHLITEVFKSKKYFDFGISNEEQGKKLNSGLCFWKESFGASTVVHDFYEVETGNYYLLETVMI